MATPADAAIIGRPLTEPTPLDPNTGLPTPLSTLGTTTLYLLCGTVTGQAVEQGNVTLFSGETTFGRSGRPVSAQQVLSIETDTTTEADAILLQDRWQTMLGNRADVIISTTGSGGAGPNYVSNASGFIGNAFINPVSTFSGSGFDVAYYTISTVYASAAPPDVTYLADKTDLANLPIPSTTIFAWNIKYLGADPDELTSLAFSLTDLSGYGLTSGLPTDDQIKTFFGLT